MRWNDPVLRGARGDLQPSEYWTWFDLAKMVSVVAGLVAGILWLWSLGGCTTVPGRGTKARIGIDGNLLPLDQIPIIGPLWHPRIDVGITFSVESTGGSDGLPGEKHDGGDLPAGARGSDRL